ncbi:uncharacterized protein LOC132724968 isoform X2 [Ruditapes philippinarum]|nr:uncharacterized protein LOC132724968 isoform X2 [Ruditapes philippinarum]XP_060565939.1 uncharacterized protein LOC132724968 isoform X2 [Ruditapes philippinarum]
MIGFCHHVSLRFRILCLLFTVVSFYSITWLFNFRVVSYHSISRTTVDSVDETLRLAMNHTSKNTNRSTSESFSSIATKGKENASLPAVVSVKRKAKENKRTKYLGDLFEKELRNNLNKDDIVNKSTSVLSFTTKTNKEQRVYGPKKMNINFKELNITRQYRLITNKPNVQVAKQDVMLKPDTVSAVSKNQSNLIQLSLEYKPNIETGSPELLHVISPHQKKNVQASAMHFDPQAERLNSSFVDKSKNFIIHHPLLLKESNNKFVLNGTKGETIDTESRGFNDTTRVHLGTADDNNSSMISDSDQPFEQKTFVSCQYPLNASNKTKVGILIPSSTRKIVSPLLQNLTLVKLSIPSIYKTLEEKYVYRIYIGIDEGDFLQTVETELRKMYDCVIPVIVKGKNYVKSVNTIADRAYIDGMDYLVRTNDDTVFVTGNWTTIGINKLREYHPENVGVVGPTCNEGNTNILTHDMVHRQHLEIFDFYYPPYLENWWTDDWITRVYQPNKSTKLTSWIVKHIILNTRYNVDFERQKWSETLIKYDRNRLQKYIGCNCESSAGNPLIYTSLVLIILQCLVCLASKLN